ncbi:alpha-mannosidase [Clostridium perfringens]|nr:alpha-mannosidase [Clostridium perfringens]
MKKVHVVSHSHWDREWYIPFQKHRVKLVDFMDSLIDTLENNEHFKYFHLDGQTIALDDYLEVKPYMFDRLKKLIEEGRLHVGPWYVLQDEYLISAEANVRNMLLGMRFAKRFGDPVKIGYFPDSFGNISQAPQILRGFGIDNAVFGRGITPIAFDNQKVEEAGENEYHSEVLWKSPDGSEVLGILMANWYSNGNEIPADKKEAVEFLNDRVNKADMYATTNQILLMNGCDHQPVQTNVGDIIDNVKEDVDFELVHSNLVDYISDVKEEVKDLKEVTGELNGQYTDGWWTLCNTASARLYLKQMNNKSQVLLERYVEPLGVMASLEGKKYESDFILQSWKYLIQNHPHDSICGCSIDEVHQDMVTRFKASMQISEEMIDRSTEHMLNLVNGTTTDRESIVVFNTLGWDRSEVVEAIVDVNKESGIENFKVVTENGEEAPAVVEALGETFKYTLPNNRFRQPEYVNRFKVKFLANNIKALGLKSFKIVPCEVVEEKEVSQDLTFENKFFSLKFNENGTFDLLHKGTNKEYKNLNAFEDCGDIGDEYIFRAPEKDLVVNTLGNKAEIKVLKDNSVEKIIEVKNTLEVPVEAVKKESRRVEEMTEIKLVSTIVLSEVSRRVDVKVEIENTAKDHRVRALFPTGIEASTHFAEGHFDVIERETTPWEGWQNPSNCQKQTNFVDVNDGKVGLMVANMGLPEYEVLRDGENTIAITILRSVGELGDWGVFPTPEAQCLGKNVAEYSVIAHEGDYTGERAYEEAYNLNTPMLALQGDFKAEDSLVSITGENIVLSAFKKAEDRDSIIVRIFNISDKEENFQIKVNRDVKEINEVNLNEEIIEKLEVKENAINGIISKKQIKTFEIVL